MRAQIFMITSGDPKTDFDVIIIGGSFSGASAGLLLKQAMPDLRVLIVERLEMFDKKVGESTSEVAGCFLTRVLNLSTYLSMRHINKHGLRMWFHESPEDSPNDCSEIGPSFQSRLPTYQLDRSTLDEHIVGLAQQAGCVLYRPATVRQMDVREDDEPHRIEITLVGGEVVSHTCRWLLDASGKATLLAKKLGLLRPLGDEHPTSSVWTRFGNVNNLDSQQTRAMYPAFTMNVKCSRTMATNHLMGRGWWCWVIPLSDETFSVGIVWDRTIYDLPPGENFVARLHAHLLTHPVGRLMFENARPVEGDQYYYKNLAYHTEKMCGHRWTIVGDAAGFIDPLYSQGLDYCGHTVYATVELLKKFFKGDCVAKDVEYLGTAYKRSYRYWFEALYKGKYLYMGDAELMRAAFLMDLATYFIGPVRLVYNHGPKEWPRMPYDGFAGAVFAKFMAFYNHRLHVIAEKRIANGTYGAMNLNKNFLLKESFPANSRALLFLWQGVRVWWMAELRTFFSRRTRVTPPPMESPMKEKLAPQPEMVARS